MGKFTRGELEEIQAGVRAAGTYRRVTFDAGITTGKIATKAAMTTALTGGDNDITYTADTTGTAGNNITVQYRNPGSAGSPLSVRVDGTVIVVELATTVSAEKAVGTMTSDATNPANNGTFTLGSKTYTFKDTLTGAADEIKVGADAATTLDNVKSAVNATAGAGTAYGTGTTANTQATATTNTDTTQLFEAVTAGSAGNAIVFTESATHITINGSGTLVQGTDAGAITTTAADVITAIEASTAAAALVDVALYSGNDGTDLVTAMAATNLSGGSDGIVPLFTVTGTCLVSLRGYVVTTLTGATATLVHGKTGTTNDLITILTATNLTALSGIDSTGAVARGTALAKTPLKSFTNGQTIFATVATASVTGGVIEYIADWIGLSEGACVSIT